MKDKWNKIAGLLFSVAALLCVAISIFQQGNNIFLATALICSGLSSVLLLLINRKEK